MKILLFFAMFQSLKGSRKQLFYKDSTGGRLTKNVVSSYYVGSILDCSQHCLIESLCIAYNYRETTSSSPESRLNCQLTNTTKDLGRNKYGDTDWTLYATLEVSSPCLKMNPCKNNGICEETGYRPQDFVCKCPIRYEGRYCETPKVFSSCKEILSISSEAESGVYNIKTDTTRGFTRVYCHMTSLGECSGGGWTMVMKIDGAKSTFVFVSPLWTNVDPYNINGGVTAFDDRETKLPTFNSTPFTELCAGMKVNDVTKYLLINYPATSLYSLFAGNTYRQTDRGRQNWKNLISGSSLQTNCMREGFNAQSQFSAHTHVRLGIIGNNEPNCISSDSFLGFGGKVVEHTGCTQLQLPHSPNSCGNFAICAADNGEKNIKTMCYMLVR